MIKGILIVNNHGKPRIVKFYEHVVRLRVEWSSIYSRALARGSPRTHTDANHTHCHHNDSRTPSSRQ